MQNFTANVVYSAVAVGIFCAPSFPLAKNYPRPFIQISPRIKKLSEEEDVFDIPETDYFLKSEDIKKGSLVLHMLAEEVLACAGPAGCVSDSGFDLQLDEFVGVRGCFWLTITVGDDTETVTDLVAAHMRHALRAVMRKERMISVKSIIVEEGGRLTLRGFDAQKYLWVRW